MRRRFLVTIVTLLVIAVISAVAVFYAKGYRPSQTGGIAGTGILSVTSVPDQASVYLDGHLTTATNANINSLIPKSYDVRIVKEGFISWQKKVEVKEGLVTEIKATLFRSLPSVYPLTYNGVERVVLSPDAQQIAYIVPIQEGADQATAKKSGVWVWQMSDRPIAFARGAEPHQISISQGGLDLSKGELRWSPDSSQILVTMSDRQLLLDSTKLNDPPRDVTAVVQVTLKSWDDDQKKRDLTNLQTIKDLKIRQTASNSAVLKWAPDKSRILYCNSNCDYKPDNKLSVFKVADLSTNKVFDIPPAAFYTWTADSDHLILSQTEPVDPKKTTKEKSLSQGTVAIIEYDGTNKAEIYGGNFDPGAVIPWPDGSKLVIVSSFPTATASQPNLYGISLK